MARASRSCRSGEPSGTAVRPSACVASLALHAGGLLMVAGLVGPLALPVHPAPRWMAIDPHAPAPEPLAAPPRPDETAQVMEPPLPTLVEDVVPPRPLPLPPPPQRVRAAALPAAPPLVQHWLARVRHDPAPVVDDAPPSPVLVEPTPLASENRPPDYPEPALRQRVEGSVFVELQLTANGTVLRARILRSSGSTLLDDAALAALSRWRFVPAKRDGVAVDSTFRQEVIFRIPAAS